jgi:hypothetical protein
MNDGMMSVSRIDKYRAYNRVAISQWVITIKCTMFLVKIKSWGFVIHSETAKLILWRKAYKIMP